MTMTPSAQHGEPWKVQELGVEIGLHKVEIYSETNNGERLLEGALINYDNFDWGKHHEKEVKIAERAVVCVNALRSVANPAAIPGLLKVIQSVSEIAEGYRSDNDMDRILKAFDATQYQERTAEG